MPRYYFTFHQLSRTFFVINSYPLSKLGYLKKYARERIIDGKNSRYLKTRKKWSNDNIDYAVKRKEEERKRTYRVVIVLARMPVP